MLAEARLISSLGRRITHWSNRADPDGILDPSALAEARALAAAVSTPDGAAASAAYATLAWFHLCRFQALPEGADAADFFAAARWFSMLPASDIDDVPAPLRAVAGFGGTAEALVVAAFEVGQRLEELDDPWGRERGTALWREALAGLPADHPDRADVLAAGGANLLERAQRSTAHPGDLAEGIALTREALDRLPASHPQRHALIGNLAVAHQHRYELTGATGDLDEAVRLLREVHALVRPGDPQGLFHTYQLVGALLVRARAVAAAGELDEAVALARQVVRDAGDVIPAPNAGNLLLVALQARYEAAGDDRDLAESLRVARDLLASDRLDDVTRAGVLTNLSLGCLASYRRTNDVELLDEGIEAARAAVRLLPADHPQRAGAFNNLSLLLQLRSTRTGATEDADSAIAANAAAVDALSGGHADYAGILAMRGAALFARFMQTRQKDDLAEAVTVMRQAAGLIAPGHPHRGGFLTNLGIALSMFAAFEDEPDRAAFAEAVGVHREALRETAPDAPDRAPRLVNFAGSVNAMTQWFGDLGQLDDAVDATAEALAVLPPGRAERVGALNIGARARWLRYEHRRRVADAEAAIAAWHELAGIADAPVRNRVYGAREAAAGRADLHGPAAALDLYAVAVELLPLLAWRGLDRSDRQRLLGTVSGLAADAAAAAIAAGRPERAVELLEQARGVLWTQLLETRTDVTALRDVDPGLAEEFEQARDALNDPGPGVENPILSDAVDRRGDVAGRFDAVVGRIRALPPSARFPRPDRFLRPATWDELRAGVGDRDVVMVTASRWRSDALVIAGGAVTVVELPDLRPDDLDDHIDSYLGGAGAGPTRDIDPPAAGGPSTARQTHAWLWQAVAAPVLTALGRQRRDADWPRLWWCPTGLLALLPLHAAGRGDDTVLDRVVSSYVPTLRALTAAPPATAVDERAGVLVVAMPETPGQPSLPAVDDEVRMLRRTLDAPQVLSGASATGASVLAALSHHRAAHVSCHGTQDLADPSEGGLLLHDGLLRITDLLAPGQVPGDWIFLSACKTATGGSRTVDEAITLAAALSYGGWRQVIGTLWTVDDAVAARVAELVYSTAVAGGTPAARTGAQALHLALRQVRDLHPGRPDRWAPFVHLGA